MAAAYLFHVSQAPGFVDGNKRAALAAALAFLSLNGYELQADADELYALCMAVAAGAAGKADAAVFFAKRVRELPNDRQRRLRFFGNQAPTPGRFVTRP